MEADDILDPVADHSRGILDGHIVLSRRLAQKNHYPAIEITESLSRLMEQIADPEHLQEAAHLRRIVAAYRENEELIALGAYTRGNHADIDEAIDKIDDIRNFLCQRIDERSSLEQSLQELFALRQVGKQANPPPPPRLSMTSRRLSAPS